MASRGLSVAFHENLEHPLQRIAHHLAHRGVACTNIDDEHLNVPATGPDGFEILIIRSGPGFLLCIGGLEEHVSSDQDAIEWAARAQSSEYRLKTDYAGTVPRRWSLERLQRDGAWQTVLASGHVGWFQSKRHSKTEYRSNAIGRTIAGALCLAVSLLSDGAGTVAYASSPNSEARATDPDRSAISPLETVDIGIALARQGEAAAALAKFDEAIRVDPNLPAAYLNRGVAHANGGALPAAIDDFTVVISLDAGNVRAYYNRGFSHWRLRAYSDAQRDFDRAIEIAPGYPNAYAGRALVRAAHGLHEPVIADCDKAIELGLDSPMVRATRGFAFMALGRNANAIGDFLAAAAADPVNAPTYTALVNSLSR
jgi:tetratricopeptide (TPR) repeat protein